MKLPAKSLLGAPNNLPNPYHAGVDWGLLPPGRVWGSTAGVSTAPGGTIWVADRCGNSGSGGQTCSGASAIINPIFQFDTAGRLLKSFGAGMFVSPHKLEIDKEGNVWVVDNGGDQVFKLDRDGKVLMTLGKKGVAGIGADEFDAPTDVAFGVNCDFFVSDGHTGGGTATRNARILKFDKKWAIPDELGQKRHGAGGIRCAARARGGYGGSPIRRRPAE